MLNLYNTLSKQIEPLAAGKDGIVRMYTCGPTVYDHAHIGNLRSFILADALYRTLKRNGQKVHWVMNITDIEDKIIRSTIAEHGDTAGVEHLHSFTQRFTQAFLDDLRKVNVSVDEIEFIKVTDVIPQIQEFIVELMDKGLAYRAEDNSTYFSIEKYQAEFGDYGDLIGKKFLEGKKIGARVAVDEYDKDNLSDFALWKAHSADDAQIFWDHPILGQGRPGWHIECSVINKVAFKGQPTDLHTGGIDLVFPHHTNEIAQSQPFGPFVKHWFHSEHLLIDNKKMAKSAKNFFTLKDVSAKGLSPLDLRYTFFQSHYKTQQNFTWDTMHASHQALQKLYAQAGAQTSTDPAKFEAALNDDLNMPRALAAMWEQPSGAASFDDVLGLDISENAGQVVEIPAQIQQLLDQRQKARDDKDFARSDDLRQQIASLGYTVKDTSDGQKISKI